MYVNESEVTRISIDTSQTFNPIHYDLTMDPLFLEKHLKEFPVGFHVISYEEMPCCCEAMSSKQTPARRSGLVAKDRLYIVYNRQQINITSKT